MLIEEFSLEPKKIKELIDKHKQSAERQKMIDAERYYDGDNVTVSQLQKVFWSDKEKRMKPNPYKANEKIGSGFYEEMEDLYIYTLLGEPPLILPKDASKQKNRDRDKEREAVQFLIDELGESFGNDLQEWARQARIKGTGFVYRPFVKGEETDEVDNVFETENIIEFVDDYSNKLGALYRYWEVQTANNGVRLIVEVYVADGAIDGVLGGLYVFKEKTAQNGNIIELAQDGERRPFKARQTKYPNGDIIPEAPIDGGRFRIIRFFANKKRKASLTPNIRSKIDGIDKVLSGFANNFEDFADIYWSIKDSGNGMSSDEMEDFLESVARRKNIVSDGGAEAVTIPIPDTARETFINILQKMLARETGVFDRTSTGNVTATEIEAILNTLTIRVVKFEYWAYKAVRAYIDLVLEDLGRSDFEYEVIFNKKFPKSMKDFITNMVMVQGDMSQVDRLRILQLFGLIESVDGTLEALEAESAARYNMQGVSDDEPTDEGDVGEGE